MLLSVILQIKIVPRQIQNEEKDADTLKESEEPVEKNLNPKLYATLEELEKEKLPPEEILSLPMFKVLGLNMLAVINFSACTLSKIKPLALTLVVLEANKVFLYSFNI